MWRKSKVYSFSFFFYTESLSVLKPFKSSRILHIRLDAWKNYKRYSIADRCYHYRFAAACFPILVLTCFDYFFFKRWNDFFTVFSMPIFPSNPSFFTTPAKFADDVEFWSRVFASSMYLRHTSLGILVQWFRHWTALALDFVCRALYLFFVEYGLGFQGWLLLFFFGRVA